MNSTDSRIAESHKILLGIITSEPQMSTLARAFVDPSGNLVAYADANGNLVNGSGGLIGSGQSKAPCRAATTANITIATALNNGDTLDTSITLATGDRVLVKNQTLPAENGIYIVGVTPIRATDFDSWREVPGAVVGVTAGTVNAGLTFIAIAAQSGTIDTTAIAFNPYPSTSGFTSPIITTDIRPNGNDGASLGTAALSFSDLFLASGGVLNYANGNVVVTHTSGILTMGTGELRITTPGTNAASVPTLGSTSTLTGKTLTSPVVNTPTVKDLTEVVTATNVIAAGETGSTFFLNSATEFVSTLPATAAGLRFKFIVTAAPSGASYTVICAASGTLIKGHVLSSQDAGGNGDSETSGALTLTFVDGKAVAGDQAEFECDGTNWFVTAKCKTFDAITIS